MEKELQEGVGIVGSVLGLVVLYVLRAIYKELRECKQPNNLYRVDSDTRLDAIERRLENLESWRQRRLSLDCIDGRSHSSNRSSHHEPECQIMLLGTPVHAVISTENEHTTFIAGADYEKVGESIADLSWDAGVKTCAC